MPLHLQPQPVQTESVGTPPLVTDSLIQPAIAAANTRDNNHARPAATDNQLADVERIAALHQTELLDSPAEEGFDRLTRLASQILRAPVSLVSLVDAERQFFKSAVGLSQPWAARRQTPLTHSFCRYVVEQGEPLLVEDARQEPLLQGSRAIDELGVVAYAGMPLFTREGYALGSLCVIDHQPRAWTEEEIDALRDLAALATTEIELRRTVREVKEQAEEARQNSHRAERERREKQALLDSTGEGIYGMDREGRCTFWSRAAAGMTRYEPEEVLGRNIHELIHHSRPDGTSYPEKECPIFQAARLGEGCRIDDEVLFRKDGTSFPAEYASSPIIEDGAIRGAVVTFANITRRKQLEQLRDDLTHMIVHDLRTPLTSLLTGLQTVPLMGELNSEQSEMVTLATDGAKTLLGMINDLLDIDKMESGSLSLEMIDLSASDLVERAVSQVAMLAQSKGLNLLTDVEEGLPSFHCDADKLRRVLVNLLGNALKFTSEGSVTVGVKRSEDGEAEESEESLTFFVRDTGEGIPEEAFGRIFEKFGQVESRQGGRKMSTGLGLTFCRMVVEAHGGRIWIESKLGQGSTFWFTIPATAALPRS